MITLICRVIITRDEGLEICSARTIIYFHDYSYVEVVRNICRHTYFYDKVCIIHLCTQCLYLQSRVLLCIFQTVVAPRSGHEDEISHKDVALLDYILRGRLVNLGYTIIRHMLCSFSVVNCSLPHDNFIIRILKLFQVPTYEPTFNPTKVVGEKKNIYSLGFDWQNEERMKIKQDKSSLLALRDDRILNVVIPADQLSDFSLPLRG